MTSFTGMGQWSERAPAVADLLNPALTAAIIAATAIEYDRRVARPMPFELAFLMVPLVLHRETRSSLPIRIDSHLATWVTTHEVLAAGFGARAKALVEPVREGLRFGLRHGAISVDRANITGHLRPYRPAEIGDMAEIVKKARFIGRWFTQLESSATAFALLGVEV
ncbi:three component ABC system middle component [Nocardia brasiliensis]|uniref:three component ABC system middle component n=1 Tax=Nocardia brasiliensis TaxID=37326 RepID=UPI002455AB73|nr:three component ABC system middle component [Nocardia brasiliensis]